MKCLFEIGCGLFSLINVLYTAESTGGQGLVKIKSRKHLDGLYVAICGQQYDVCH